MVAPIQTVQIGCGNRGQAHANALSQSDAFDLVAVCDLDHNRAETTAATFAVPAFGSDLENVLDEHRPTHVTVVTPATVRESVLETVIDFEPASIVFEKPVATTYEEVVRIKELVDDTASHVVVCHQHIYGEELQALKRWLDQGRIGNVERLVGTTNGGLYEHGTHFLHTLNWLLDDQVEWVSAHCAWGDHPFDDWHAAVEPTDALVELAYASGPRGFLHLGPAAPSVPAQEGTFWLEYRLDIIGTDGHAQFVLGSHASCRSGDERIDRLEVEGFDPDGASTAALYEELADVLGGRQDLHPSRFSTAFDAHRIVEASLQSGTREKRVDLASISN